MFKMRVDLIGEGMAPAGLTAAAGACGVASLDHEIGDDAVDGDIFVVAASDEGEEVLAGLRHMRGLKCYVSWDQADLGCMLVVELNGDVSLALISNDRSQAIVTSVANLTIVVSILTNFAMLGACGIRKRVFRNWQM